jgi:ABC-type transport system substrate-binding protein
MRDFSEADSVAYRSDPRWRGMGEFEPATTTAGLFMNTGMPPFENRHLRRAVAFALDRNKVAAVRPVHIQATHQVVPEVILKLPATAKLQRHDYAQALAEMRLAGYPYDPKTGRGGYPAEIPYIYNVDSSAEQAAEVYQQELARIGIRIRLQAVGWPTFLARSQRPKSTPMGYVGWAADYPEPSDFYEPLFTSGAIQEEESQNVAFFSNAEFDGAVARARRTTDTAERTRLYQRAEEILAAEAPWAVGYNQRYFELWQPYVHCYRPHPVQQQNVRFAWLDLKEKRRVTSAGKWWLPPGRRGQTRLAALLGVRP